MKPGDLVRYRSTTPENRTHAQLKVGTVLKDFTMWDCREDGTPKERFGRLTILWSCGNIEDVVLASLEVISERR